MVDAGGGGATPLYFEKISAFIFTKLLKAPSRGEKKTKTPGAEEDRVGVMGEVVSWARVVECQGRTLLHTHMLIWCAVSPELVQQAAKKKLDELMGKIIAFLDEICSTKMPEEFWAFALGKWRAHERVPAPGLTFIRDDLAQGEDNLEVAPPPSEARAAEEITAISNSASMCRLERVMWWRFVRNVYLWQVHWQHKFTCFKNASDSGGRKKFCRMAMPAGLWPHPTMLIAIRLVRDDTADRRKVVLRPEAVMHPGPNAIKCTHVFGCGCASPPLISRRENSTVHCW